MITHKARTHHKHTHGKSFAKLKLFVSLAVSSVAVVYPNFLKDILGSDSKVGLFYSFIAILSFIVTLFSTEIFQRFRRVAIVNLTLSLSIGVYIILTAIGSFQSLIFVEVFRIVSIVLIGLSISLFVRDFSRDEELGKNEGELFLFDNIGYFVGPLVAGYLAYRFNYDAVFLIAALFSLGAYSYFNHQYFVKNHKYIKNKVTRKKGNLVKNARDFFKNKENVKSFIVKFGLEYWWTIFYFYGPLYIINAGFDAKVSGFVIGGTVIPLIILEVLIGKLSDKHGYKQYLVVGYFSLAAIAILMAYLGYPIMVMVLMFLTSFAVALIEPLQDMHFFKTVPQKEEDRLYGIFMLSFSFAQILAPATAAVLLIFFGANGVWYGVAAVSIVSGLVASRIKEK